LAKCHLLLGNWSAARESAEKVLSVDCKHVKAIFAKAESLYNTCQFETALVLFHRGSVGISTIILQGQFTKLKL
jgi:hypothetical protein